MGANQSQSPKEQQEKKRIRKRDIVMGMCMSKQQQKDAQRSQKLTKSLSENMKQQNLDILSKLGDEELSKYSIKILQYLFNFLTIHDCIQLKFVNRKLKFMVEMSSNIYSNFLSQQYMRKIQLPYFVEYGFDSRFLSTYSETLNIIEANQDESWIRIYSNYQRSIHSIKIIEEEIHKHSKFNYHFSDKLLEVCKHPILPIPILTDDVLKQSTTSWFQLEMTQKLNEFTKIESLPGLEQLIEELYQQTLKSFKINDLVQTQVLMELRWLIIDNYIKDPSTLIQNNIPLLFQLALEIMHFLYQRCLFSRNVLIILKREKKPAQFLSVYSLLWESFVGIAWSLNRGMKRIYEKINMIFNTFFNTDFPSLSFVSAIGRMWSQVVLKGTKNQETLDIIENEIIQSFCYLFSEKRVATLTFFMNDHFQLQRQKSNSFNYFEDAYFQSNPSATNYLLNRVVSDILDISLHEQSIHWIGHSKVKIGFLYGQLLEQVVNTTNSFYTQASEHLSIDFLTFKKYILADTQYMKEILNSWTIQVCLLPIGLDYLYEKVKINLRQYVLNCELNQNIVEEISDQEDNILESQILSSDQLTLKIQEADELTTRIDKEESLLEAFIYQIIKEEKICFEPKLQQFHRPTIQKQQSGAFQQSMLQGSSLKQQSIIEGDSGKTRMLSTYSISTRASQITTTCLTSVYSQQILSSFKTTSQVIYVKDIKTQLENNDWANYLKDIQIIEIANQIIIDNRNNQVEMRNFIRQIPPELIDTVNENIQFSKIWNLEETISLYVQKLQFQFDSQKPACQTKFSEINVTEGSFAQCILQQV